MDAMIQSAQGDTASELDLDGNKKHQIDVAPLSDPERLSPGLMQPALLAHDVPRSEHDTFIKAAETGITMHPFTGAFADPSHENAFAAQLFRGALPFHVLIILMIIAIVMFMALDVVPALRPLWGTVVFGATLFLICRVLLHYMQDAVCGQRLGIWTWTVGFLASVMADSSFSVMDPDSTCAPTQEQYLVRQLNPMPSPNLNPNPNLPNPTRTPTPTVPTVTITLAVTLILTLTLIFTLSLTRHPWCSLQALSSMGPSA